MDDGQRALFVFELVLIDDGQRALFVFDHRNMTEHDLVVVAKIFQISVSFHMEFNNRTNLHNA